MNEQKNISSLICPFCGTRVSAQSATITCDSCGGTFIIPTQLKGEFLVLHIGHTKQDRWGNLMRWIKVTDTRNKPILFPYPSDKVDSLGLKSGDIIFVAWKIGTQKNHGVDVDFLSRPEQLNYVRSEVVDLHLSIKLEDITFHDDHISSYLHFGEETTITTNSGYTMKAWRGDLYPVETSYRTLGARKISVVIPEKVWKIYNPDFDLSWSLNKIKDKLAIEQQKEVALEIQGKFRVYYNFDNTVTLSSTEDIVVVRQNMMNIKKLVEDDLLAKRWKEVRARVREILKLKHILSVEELTEVLEKNQWSTDNVDETIKNLTWSAEYDEQYFEHLKSISQNLAYFSDRGYFFEYKDKTLWEVPKNGSATYVFLGKPSEVIAKLGDLTKTELWEAKREIPESMFFYRGRVIHRDFEQWSEDLRELID